MKLFPMAILIQGLIFSWTSLNAETPQDYGAPSAGQVRTATQPEGCGYGRGCDYGLAVITNCGPNRNCQGQFPFVMLPINNPILHETRHHQ